MKTILFLMTFSTAFFALSKPFIEEKQSPALDLSKGKWSWSCKNKTYKVNNRILLNYEVNGKGSIIHDLTADGYAVIKGAQIQPDERIGQSVFNVRVGKLTKVSPRQMTLEMSLQDYSDQQSFHMILIGDNEFGTDKYFFKAVMISTLFTSDGDEQLHTTPEILDCTAKTEK